MEMHMSFINMNSKVILILPFEELFTKLLSDLQCPIGSDLPRLKALNKML